MQKSLFSILFVIAFSFFSSAISAQELLSSLPNTKEEFISSESSFITSVNWLEDMPMNEQKEKRDKQKSLIMAWLVNSPTVTISIQSEILEFSKKNPDLMLTFMGGWARYILENNYSEDAVAGNLAGIKSVIKVYKNNPSLKKDKEVDKLIELDNKNQLETWVKSKVK